MPHVDTLNLTRQICKWEVKRTERLALEERFKNFSGRIDAFEVHIPYTRYDLVRKAVLSGIEFKGKKMALLLGDCLNLDAYSHFHPRTEVDNLPSEEIQDLIHLLKFLKKYYDQVVYLVSNHESRMQKVILDNIHDKSVAQEIIKQMRTIKDYFEEYGLDVVYVDHPFVQIGDTLFCHIENNKSVLGSLSRDMVSYFAPRISKTVRAIVQAHTHCSSLVMVDKMMVIECAAMCMPMDYARRGKMMGTRKMSSIGYGQVMMKNGEIIYNQSRPIFMEWEPNV